jgi:purine-binding chemotaxis protein CheW
MEHMSDSAFESQQVANQKSQIKNPTVWDRLRERMDEMAASRTGETAPAALAQKLATRAKALRRRVDAKEGAHGDVCSFVAFNKGQQRYGVPIDDILEIHSLDQFVPVPGAPSFAPGVIHWRGVILTLLDLQMLFGVQERGLADLHACLVVEAADTRVALVAGEIEDIVSVPADSLKTAPELPGDIPEGWVIGVHEANRLILCMGELLRDPKLVDFRRQKTLGLA